MLALGGLLVSVALLALAALAVLFRRPNAPRWTTRSWVHEIGIITVVCLLTMGVAYLITGGVDAYQAGVHLVDLGLLAGVLVVACVVWRRLDVRAQLRAFDAARDAHMRGAAVAGAKVANLLDAQQRVPASSSTATPPSADRAA